MKKRISILCIILMLIGLLPGSVYAYSGNDIDWSQYEAGRDYVADEVMVCFKADLEDQKQIYGIAGECGCRVEKIISWGDSLGLVVLANILDGASVSEAIGKFEAYEEVEYAEANGIYYVQEPEEIKEIKTYYSVDWMKVREGVDYVPGRVSIEFFKSVDKETAEIVAVSCGCQIDTYVNWDESKKAVEMEITDGSTVKKALEKLYDSTFVKRTSPVLIERNGKIGDRWVRAGGKNRYETMQTISVYGWKKDSGGTVIVASGQDFPDALTGTSLAGVYDSPMILTKPDELPKPAIEELLYLKPEDIIIVGGVGAVSEEVEAYLKAMAGDDHVTRLQGKNRYKTAQDVYEFGMASWNKTVILATGRSSADSLTIAPYAYASHTPIFPVKENGELPTYLNDILVSGAFDNAIIVGGTGVVSEDLETVLIEQMGEDHVIRLAGRNRYRTSSIVADWATGNMPEAALQPETLLTYDYPALGNGYESSFSDVLAGSAFCGHNRSVLLLLQDPYCMGNNYVCVNNILHHYDDMHYGYVLGGTSVVSDSIIKDFNSLVYVLASEG